jgi:hypothetical protein
MKLTKTQMRLLLEAAREQDGECSTTTAVGHGGNGGSAASGGRDNAAACKLRDLGLLEFAGRSTHQESRNGWHTFVTSVVWRITGAGRTVANELRQLHEGNG